MNKLRLHFALWASLLLLQPAVADDSHQVLLKTTLGDIVLQLDAEKAPQTVANFETYVSEGFYDGLIFHRVIDGFMIQGGGFEPGMKEKATKPTINNEADNGLSNKAGTIAMARRGDPHSASAQFFINVNDNTNLDHHSKTTRGWGYAVFGKVISGMEVIDKIRQVKTTTKSWFKNVPEKDVIIEKATLIP